MTHPRSPRPLEFASGNRLIQRGLPAARHTAPSIRELAANRATRERSRRAERHTHPRFLQVAL